MQEISLNPQKLAGQCSKLKCCLMYEYDVYADARRSIPRLREPLQAMDGEYYLVKTDVLAHTMSFSSSKEAMVNVVTIPVSRVREILALNRAGKKVDTIVGDTAEAKTEEPTYRTEEDSITRFDKTKRRNKNNRGKGRNNRGQHASTEGNGATSAPTASAEGAKESKPQQPSEGGERSERNERSERRGRGFRPHRNNHHRHNNDRSAGAKEAKGE
jgi:hypothetical protein